MKAKFEAGEFHNAINLDGEKERVSSYKLVAIHKGEIVELVDCRVWMAKGRNASKVYASIWIHGKHARTGESIYHTGKGDASGWGYHKESAAIGAAITSAGVTLWGDNYHLQLAKPAREDFKKRAYIDGCGDSSVQAALQAIGIAMGYRKTRIV